MPLLSRDVWPVETPEGDGHWQGTECPCAPWSYWQGRVIVVVHGWFTEQIIHTSAPDEFEDADTGVRWEEMTW